MKIVTMKGGHVAYVDDEDYERVNAYTWSRMNHGSAQARIGKIRVQMHRFILNAQPGQTIDHINHNRLDNRRSNLRMCSHAQNSANKRGWSKTCEFKGVFDTRTKKGYTPPAGGHGPRHRPYQARIKGVYLGSFHTAIEAARVYDIAARRIFGEFALTNFTETFFSNDSNLVRKVVDKIATRL